MKDEQGSGGNTRVPAYGGLAVFGAAITGLLGWVLVVAGMYSEDGILAGAVALIASALAFGLLVNALFRK